MANKSGEEKQFDEKKNSKNILVNKNVNQIKFGEKSIWYKKHLFTKELVKKKLWDIF